MKKQWNQSFPPFLTVKAFMEPYFASIQCGDILKNVRKKIKIVFVKEVEFQIILLILDICFFTAKYQIAKA